MPTLNLQFLRVFFVLALTPTLILDAGVFGVSSFFQIRLGSDKMQKEKAFLFGKRVGGTGLDLQDGSTSESFADGGVLDSDGNLVRTTYGIVSAIEIYGSSTSTVDYTWEVFSLYLLMGLGH